MRRVKEKREEEGQIDFGKEAEQGVSMKKTKRKEGMNNDGEMRDSLRDRK